MRAGRAALTRLRRGDRRPDASLYASLLSIEHLPTRPLRLPMPWHTSRTWSGMRPAFNQPFGTVEEARFSTYS